MGLLICSAGGTKSKDVLCLGLVVFLVDVITWFETGFSERLRRRIVDANATRAPWLYSGDIDILKALLLCVEP